MIRWARAVVAGVLAIAVQLPAAATELQSLDPEGQALQQYTGQGKWTVVMIWASDCHVCNREAHQYVDFHTFHKDDDAQVVGISMDGQSRRQQAQAFLERHQVNFPNLIGEPRQVARLYTRYSGAPWVGTPSFLVFDPDGRLRAQQVGAVPTEMIVDFIARNSTSKSP